MLFFQLSKDSHIRSKLKFCKISNFLIMKKLISKILGQKLENNNFQLKKHGKAFEYTQVGTSTFMWFENSHGEK